MDVLIERTKALLPDRYPQKELFLCDLGDVALKDDMASMEHPIFTLSKKPDITPRMYSHKNVTLEVTPSVLGLATIWDKDVLIFAISQLMAAKRAKKPISQYIEFNAKDFLVFSNRSNGGIVYDRLRDALRRLSGTRLTTTLKTGGEVETNDFGLIDSVRIKHKHSDGRVLQWGIKISDWLYRAIEADEVLTLSPLYFRLRMATERRIYEIARKHCGASPEWHISQELLYKKCGTRASMREFRRQLKKISQNQNLPDYDLVLGENKASFLAKAESKLIKRVTAKLEQNTPHALTAACIEHSMLLDSTWEEASRLAAKSGFDKYSLFEQFRERVGRQGMPRSLDTAFLGYLRAVSKNTPPRDSISS